VVRERVIVKKDIVVIGITVFGQSVAEYTHEEMLGVIVHFGDQSTSRLVKNVLHCKGMQI
jgi:hypothetical protein